VNSIYYSAEFIACGEPGVLIRLAFVRALGLVDAGGAAGAAGRPLTASMGQSKTHEQYDQKYDWSDEFFH
jgi:hypothetical protein